MSKMNKEVTYFGAIYETKDYRMFDSILSNRKINPVNYSKLLRSMKEEQLIIPICVNEKNEVIDGQHRLKVCEELDLPVYYYVLKGYTVAQMKRANLVSANWKKDDFLNAYVNEENIDYIDFADMQEKYGLNTMDLIKIIAKVQGTKASSVALDFEEGNLNISTTQRKEITKFLVALEDFNFFKDYKKSKFVGAFLELFYFSAYDHNVMKTKLKTRKVALDQQLTKDDYIGVLTNKIYSFSSSKNSIHYDIERKKLYVVD